MRKLHLLLVAVLLFSVTALQANEGVAPTKRLAVQIQEILNDNGFPLESGEIKAEVRFTINKEGEIVILSVDTLDETLEGFVKGRLNYQKVQLASIREGKIYSVPVLFRA